MKKSLETKLMIIENFIDHIETNEVQRKKLKTVALQYVEEDHVDEVAQSIPEKTKLQKAYDTAGGLLSFDTQEELEAMIKAIVTHPDQTQTIDYIDGVVVWEKVEYQFNARTFLEYIDYPSK